MRYTIYLLLYYYRNVLSSNEPINVNLNYEKIKFNNEINNFNFNCLDKNVNYLIFKIL